MPFSTIQHNLGLYTQESHKRNPSFNKYFFLSTKYSHEIRAYGFQTVINVLLTLFYLRVNNVSINVYTHVCVTRESDSDATFDAN